MQLHAARLRAREDLSGGLLMLEEQDRGLCYALLEQVSPSPLHRLNRAIAVAEWKGPAAGLEVLAGAEPPTWLAGSYQWAAVLADLHRRAGNQSMAERYRKSAMALAPTRAVRDLLQRRLRVDRSR